MTPTAQSAHDDRLRAINNRSHIRHAFRRKASTVLPDIGNVREHVHTVGTQRAQHFIKCLPSVGCLREVMDDRVRQHKIETGIGVGELARIAGVDPYPIGDSL